MDEAMSRRWLVAVSTILVVCGCSGADRPTPQPASTSGTTIGPAGGTVLGPSGAKVVIPAGALSAPTLIAITQTSTGAPDLPTGVVPSGDTFAFTPHGTTFAVPVEIAVPFDPTRVLAGTPPVLYKTNLALTGCGHGGLRDGERRNDDRLGERVLLRLRWTASAAATREGHASQDV